MTLGGVVKIMCKTSQKKLLTLQVLAAIVTILIANAMGWVDTGEIIEKFERFHEYKMAVAGVFIA